MAQILRLQSIVLLGLIALTATTNARPGQTFIISGPANVVTINSFAVDTFSDHGPFKYSNHDFISFRDCIKETLSVIVDLLFGIGCGAVTAATMCLVLSMCFVRDKSCNSHDNYVDKIKNPKKLGHVKVPTKETVAQE